MRKTWFVKFWATVYCLVLFCALPAEARNTLRVGFFHFDGYHMDAGPQGRSGYGYDYLQYMARYTNWTYTYVGYDKSWFDMQDMLERGDIDILTSAQKTPERESRFAFSEKPIGSSAILLTVKAGNKRYVPGEYAGFNGMRVGMLRENTCNARFGEFAKTHGFTYTPVFFTDSTQLKKALQDGKDIDAAVTSSLRTLENEWLLERFDPSPFYVMVRKDDAWLLSQVNYALSQLALNYPMLNRKLSAKYYSPHSGNELPLSVAEREYLDMIRREGRVFRAAVNPDSIPLSGFSEGTAQGIIPEIAEEIFHRAGIRVQLVPMSSREEYDERIQNGGMDIRLDARTDFSNAERLGYKLTEPYLALTLSRLTRHNTDHQPRSIAALQTVYLPPDIRDAIYPKDTTTYYNTVAECVEAVRSGRQDATYLYTFTAEKILHEDERNTFRVALLPEYTVERSLAVSVELDHRLLSILNKSAQSVANNYTAQVTQRYMDGVQTPPSLTALLYANPGLAAGLAVILTLCLAALALQSLRAKNARLERLRSEEYARLLGYVCAVNDAVMEVDRDAARGQRYVMRKGEVCQETVPYHTENLFGSRVHPDDREAFDAIFSESALNALIASGEQRYIECRLRENEHEAYLWYSYTVQGVNEKIHPNRFILFRKNIDAAKQEEQKSRQTLVDALENARRASEAKGMFMSRVSHEIRTPLNAVIGYMSLLKMLLEKSDAAESERLLDYVEKSEFAATHLLGIINDVLDISSIESGRFKISNASFDLKRMLSTLSVMFHNQAQAKGANFVVRISAFSEEWVVGDQLRVNQILMNLLSNAIKFTPPDGTISLSVSQMEPREGKVHMRFVISDTGIGMSEEYQQRLFRPFEQESARTAQQYGGTGLGLAITKNLVSLMNGAIEVQSTQGKGTTFTVSLVFGQSDNAALHSPHDFSRVRALVVDNEQDTCAYIKSLLKRCGVKSDTVLSGEEAVQQVLRRLGTPYAYDLCFIDWDMPGLDGVQTAKKIRETCKVDMPVIIVTAYDTAEVTEAAHEAGIVRVVSKPLFQSTLLDLLTDTWGQTAQAIPKDLDATTLRGKHMLLVEDNAMNREIATTMLENAGMKADTAENGKEAVDKFLQSAPGTYTAILMDIQMPVMDGYTAVKIIRNSGHIEAKTIPVIAMTANAFAEDVAAALAAGMNAHIAKPVNYAALFAALKKCVFLKEEKV